MKKYQAGSVLKWTITNSQLSFKDPRPLKERRTPHWIPGSKVRVPHVSWSMTALWAGIEPPLPHLSTSPGRTDDPATTATESSRRPTGLLHDQASTRPSQPPFCHFLLPPSQTYSSSPNLSPGSALNLDPLCFCPTAPLNPSCWPSKNATPFKYQLTSDRTGNPIYLSTLPLSSNKCTSNKSLIRDSGNKSTSKAQSY